MENLLENNKVVLFGCFAAPLVLDHTYQNIRFFKTTVKVARASETEDLVPVLIPEALLPDDATDHSGQAVRILGQFRSWNNPSGEGKRMELRVLARELTFLGEAKREEHENSIFLSGTVCKPTIFRKTPKGREISDLVLAVNRPFRKSDYLPCICWNDNAVFAEKLQVGDKVWAIGRIQSREYTKRLPSGEEETRIAYEVSVSKIAKREADDETA